MTIRAMIDLMRHGDTGQRSYRGQLDDPLSPLGWRQAHAAVVGAMWDRVVSSPLQRCAAFARELASIRGVPLRLDARLLEYHFGTWQGIPLETLMERAGEALARYWANQAANPPPQAEPFPAFRTRVCGALGAIAVDGNRPRTLVITHGGVIRLLRCIAERRPFADMARLDVPNASLYRLRWPVDRPT